MDSTSSPTIGGISSLAQNYNEINNPKHISIRPVKNGFIVTTKKVKSYGEEADIATTLEEVVEIIKNYLNS